MLLSKNRIIRRRAVVGLLLAASLTLLTLSFRQGSSGVVGEIQRDAVSVTAPFATVAVVPVLELVKFETPGCRNASAS